MIHSLIYIVWLVTFIAGFYTVEVATERWGFPGRIAAFAVWIPGALLSGFAFPAFTYAKLGHELGIEASFSFGMHVGCVFNALFWAAGSYLKQGLKHGNPPHAGRTLR